MGKVKDLRMEFRLPLADFTNGEVPLRYPGGYRVITTSLKAKEDRKQETEDDALEWSERGCVLTSKIEEREYAPRNSAGLKSPNRHYS